MYEYQYITCPVEYHRNSVDPKCWQKVIDQQAEAGWRFVQLVVSVPAAVPTQYELIFERVKSTSH